MATTSVGILAFIPFVISGLSISYATWPKAKIPIKVGSALTLGAILLIVHIFLLLTTRGGATLAGLFLCAIAWIAIGLVIYLGRQGHRWLKMSDISRKMKETPGLSSMGNLSVKAWMAILAAIALALALLLIPLLTDLGGDLVWRYRAYMLALMGVALIGGCIRRKFFTVLIGIALVLLVSFALRWVGIYPVGTPLVQAGSRIQEGFQAELPGVDEEGLSGLMGMFSTIALVSDMVVAVLAVTLVGVSAVVLTNALAERARVRTILGFILVIILLLPGLLIPYVYALVVGGLDLGASIGMGALKGVALVEAVQDGELDNGTIQELHSGLVDAGEHFERSEVLLMGLERLRLFEFLDIVPYTRKYSQTGRYLAWGLTSAANGLQISALGVLDILNGVLIMFNASDMEEIGSFDVLGPRLMEEELDEALVAEGIDEIDSAFGQIRLGFPKIRSSLGNLSSVDPEVFEERFPGTSDELKGFLETTRDLGTGVDVADVFLSDRTNPTPATHFIYAAYSLTRIAPNMTDLRDVRDLPRFDNVVSNLSFVGDALADPIIMEIRKEGNDVGHSISFVADAIDLIESMANLGDYAIQVAEDVDRIREKFQEKKIQNLTDIELGQWRDEATTLAEHGDELSVRIDAIEDKIDSMLDKALEEQYGYANELASGGIEMLGQVLGFLRELRGLTEFSRGLKSLVFSVESFVNFYEDITRLERQIIEGNLVGASHTAEGAKDELREGRMQAEDLLTRLGNVSKQLLLPITADDVGEIVDAAAAIELKMTNLEAQLSEGDREQALEIMVMINEDFDNLANKLQLVDKFAS